MGDKYAGLLGMYSLYAISETSLTLETRTMQSQINDGFIVIQKAGTQTLEKCAISGRLVVTDSWLTDWIIFYDHKPAWAHDGTLAINRPIRRRLDVLAHDYFHGIK